MNKNEYYKAFQITQQGLEMRQKAIAEKCIVYFTRGTIGTGRPAGDIDTYYLEDMIEPTANYPVKKNYSEHQNHLMAVVIDNGSLEEDIVMTEIGIFARLEDKDTGEVIMPETLYGYTYTDKYDYLPAAQNYFLRREIVFNTVLSRSNEFTIVFDGSKVYATAEDLEKAIDEFRKEIQKIIEKLEDSLNYDNSESGLEADNIYDAIDELKELYDKSIEQAIEVGKTVDVINGKIGTDKDTAGANTIFGFLKKIVDMISTSISEALTAISNKINTNLDVKISSRAPASTALSNGVWTDAKAGYLDKINANLDVKSSTLATQATANTINSNVSVAVNNTAVSNTASETGSLSQKLSSIINNTKVNNTADKTGTLSQKETYIISQLENGTHGLAALKNNLATVGVVKSIQRGVYNGALNSSPGTPISISTVNPNKCMVIAEGNGQVGTCVSLTANTLTLIGPNSITRCSWQVVEFY